MTFVRYVTTSGEHRWVAESMAGRPVADGARGHRSRSASDREALATLAVLLDAELPGSRELVDEYVSRRQNVQTGNIAQKG